jgi:hypothetical protein
MNLSKIGGIKVASLDEPPPMTSVPLGGPYSGTAAFAADGRCAAVSVAARGAKACARNQQDAGDEQSEACHGISLGVDILICCRTDVSSVREAGGPESFFISLGTSSPR